MPGFLSRIAVFARSRQGRRLIDQARRTASDPRKRAEAKRVLGRLRGRGRRY